MLNIDTIYKLTTHEFARLRGNHYPTYKILAGASSFFHTLDEAEQFLHYIARPKDSFTYCYTISELPVGVNHHDWESFSERVYLHDGSYWSQRNCAHIAPDKIPPQYTEREFDNDLYGRCLFEGRPPEDVRFKRGDIIEILCYNANNYWSGGHVELAIVAGTPPTMEEMSIIMERYLKENPYWLTGDRGFDLGITFNANDDAYTVIPAYVPEKTEMECLTDHCPTHCAMHPRFKVSPRMQKKLQGLLERYLEFELGCCKQ